MCFLLSGPFSSYTVQDPRLENSPACNRWVSPPLLTQPSQAEHSHSQAAHPPGDSRSVRLTTLATFARPKTLSGVTSRKQKTWTPLSSSLFLTWWLYSRVGMEQKTHTGREGSSVGRGATTSSLDSLDKNVEEGSQAKLKLDLLCLCVQH